jgi:hypothetical protein
VAHVRHRVAFSGDSLFWRVGFCLSLYLHLIEIPMLPFRFWLTKIFPPCFALFLLPRDEFLMIHYAQHDERAARNGQR